MRYFLLAVVGLFLTGCMRTSSTTVVNADGTWSRSAKLTVVKGMMNAGQGEPVNPFVTPTDKRWKTTHASNEKEMTTTVATTGTLNEAPVTDILVKLKDKTVLKNFVTVREVEPGVYEYVEKFINPTPGNGSKSLTNDFDKQLKAALPAGVKCTPEQLASISTQVSKDIVHLLVGPEGHFLADFLLNPEGAGHRLKLAAGPKLEKALAANLPDLTNDQIRSTVKKMLQSVDDQLKSSTNSGPGEGKEGSDSTDSMAAMTVSVTLPGEVISTNGQVDPYTGEVFWDFLSLAFDGEPLELRARCRVKK